MTVSKPRFPQEHVYAYINDAPASLSKLLGQFWRVDVVAQYLVRAIGRLIDMHETRRNDIFHGSVVVSKTGIRLYSLLGRFTRVVA